MATGIMNARSALGGTGPLRRTGQRGNARTTTPRKRTDVGAVLGSLIKGNPEPWMQHLGTLTLEELDERCLKLQNEVRAASGRLRRRVDGKTSCF